MYGARLANVGVACSNELAYRALKRANCVADVEVIRESVGGVVWVYAVTTGLAFIKRGPSTNLTANIARVASIISAVLIAARFAALHTKMILQEKTNTRGGQETAGTIVRCDITSVAVYVAQIAGVKVINFVLPWWTG